MEIKKYSPATIIKYQNNPLKHPQEQIDKIANSIKEFGFLIPIIVDENKIIVSGHGRLEAALKLNLEEIPCIEAINFRKALEDAKLKLSQTLIWVKNGFNLSRQDYNWKHEPCLYGWKPGLGHYFINDFTQSTVLEKEQKNYKGMKKEELLKEIERLEREKDERSTIIRENKPLRNDVHPTMKPLKLVGKLILNSSKPGDLIIDFFGGSGSTLIASEELGRKARVMEYDPCYADVIVKRYKNLNKSKIMLVRSGKTLTLEEIGFLN